MTPTQLYGLGLEGRPVVVRRRDGSAHRLPLEDWTADLVPGDLGLVRRCHGAVLDVGCGPGRLTVAVARSGLPALGVDVAPAALALARSRGALVLARSVFAHLPALGRWSTVLLADGNVGIGGDPHGLLRRARQLLGVDGHVLVEVGRPGLRSWSTSVRLETGEQVSSWFPWAAVGRDDVGELASACSLRLAESWVDADRHFVSLAAA